jgi:large subunit ribosomal protein L39
MPSFQIIRNQLISLTNNYRQQSIRNYRFGNRVIKSGFYYSPTHESNKLYLKRDSERDENKLSCDELRQKRNSLFDAEKRRQSELITRVEKIEVQVINPFDGKETTTLLMNKHISTPFNCAQHLSQLLTERSVLAKINDKTYWDMNRPLDSDCSLQLRHFKEQNPYMVNKAFWRSASFLLGSVIEKAFKQDIQLSLHSWPKPRPETGSFLYDVVINLDNWIPKEEELRVLSTMMKKVVLQELKFERLDCNISLAKEMFEHNSFKAQQIDSIASSLNRDYVTLYRVGDHIDMSCGPMISNTSQIGSIFVTAIHPIQTEFGPMFRFQGIAVPKQLHINSFIFSILRERSKKLNLSGLSPEEHKVVKQEPENEEQYNDNYERTQNLMH